MFEGAGVGGGGKDAPGGGETGHPNDGTTVDVRAEFFER